MREEALFSQVRVLNDKHEALVAASGQSFNLFAILDRETDEVRTHSAILAELLNPKGSHGQGAVFARLFAKRFHIDHAGIESAQVWREVTIAEGSRADILMVVGEETCVVIENKIYAGDQPEQLQRYHAYANGWPNSKVFYLTLHGDDPSDDSLGDLPLEMVACISYESDVLAWLDDCIKEVARIPQIREILAHYQALLRKLTGKSTGELTMDLKELLENKQGDKYNFELVPDIAEAMTAFSVDKEWRFWQTLKQTLLMKEENERPWRLKPVDGIEDDKEVSKEIVRHAHVGRRNRWNYGWTFRVESERSRYEGRGVEVLLRIECDGWGWGRYGLIAVDQTKDGHRRLSRSADASGIFDEWAAKSTLEEGWHTDHERWLAWTYPSESFHLWKTTSWLAPEVIRRFMKKDCVAPLVSDIFRSVDRIDGGSG